MIFMQKDILYCMYESNYFCIYHMFPIRKSIFINFFTQMVTKIKKTSYPYQQHPQHQNQQRQRQTLQQPNNPNPINSLKPNLISIPISIPSPIPPQFDDLMHPMQSSMINELICRIIIKAPSMAGYPRTEQEKSLLSLSTSTSSLESLQPTHPSTIQIVSYNGLKVLKSVDDTNRKLRIALIAMLIKLFLQDSPENLSRLLSLKRMVYNAKLDSIVEQKAVPRNLLAKMMAEQFTSLQISPNIECQLVQCFNKTAFFDEVLLQSVKEQNPLICESDCQLISWFDRAFQIKLLVNQDHLVQEADNQMFLVGTDQEFHASQACKSCQCNFRGFWEFYRFSTDGHTDHYDGFRIYDRKTKDQIFTRLLFQEQLVDRPSEEINPSLYNTVQSSACSNSKKLCNNQLCASYKKGKMMRLFDSDMSESVNNRKLMKKHQEYGNGCANGCAMVQEIRIGEFVESEQEEGKDGDGQGQGEGGKDKRVFKVKRGKCRDEGKGSSIWRLLCCRL